MGDVSFGDATAYIKFRLGNRDDLENYNSENLYKKWFNLSYKQLTTQKTFYGLRIDYDFPELKTNNSGVNATDGVAYIDTPADCLHIYEVFDETSNKRLKWRPWSWYIKQADRDTATAEAAPTYWIVYGAGGDAGDKRVYLYKTPNTTYSIYIYYRKRVADLSATTDVTLIGAEWDEVIMESAVAMGYKWLREWTNFDKAKTDIKDLIAGVIGIPGLEELARDERIQPEPLYSLNDYYG